MDLRYEGRFPKRAVRFSPWLLAVALTPVALQMYQCETGDTELALLQVEASGQDLIDGFDPAILDYDVATSAETVLVRAQTRDPAASAYYQIRRGGALLAAGALGVGGGEVNLNIPVGPSDLKIDVRPPEGGFAFYDVDIERTPCTVDADCDDADACTTDQCDVGTGACGYEPVVCDDSSICTADSCDSVSGCLNDPIDCDDGDVCTVEVGCSDPQGCEYIALDCDDGDVCTDDLCDSVTGCYSLPTSTPPEPGVEVTCDDGIDNDCDGFVDSADLDCVPPAVCPCFTAELLQYNRPTWTGAGGSCHVGGTVATGGVALFGSTGYQTQARAHLRSNPALGGSNDIYCYRQMRLLDGSTSTLSGWGTPPGAGQVQITTEEWNACVDLVQAEITLVGLTCQ